MSRHATTAQARALRRRAPVTERILWEVLRDRRLEALKFRRQFPIGPYVVDFVCLRHLLVVEADGPFHNAESDAMRDAWIASRGFRVLRFTNAELLANDGRAIRRILAATGRCSQIGED
jgi:very-short-patch-repair endonuclease